VKILWTDEPVAKKNGRVRKDNFVFWSNKTLTAWQKKSLIFRNKSRGRICTAGVIGPFNAKGILTANICLKLLQTAVSSGTD
jgi:hypothetical protein